LFAADPLGRLSTFFIFAFTLPLLSVFFGQVMQDNWNLARFDGPSRYLIAIPVFMAVAYYRSAVPRMLELTIPAATILTLVLIPFVPATSWSTIVGRLSSHFIDPLIFGQTALALGVISLLMIRLSDRRPWYVMTLQLIGGVVGIYLSLRSGSRTGWLAIPVIVLLWVICHSPFSRWKTALFAVGIASLVTISFYFASSTVKDRVDATYSNLASYQWNAVNSETSIGDRINWIRIGWHFFSIRPLHGWGDQGLSSHINDEAITVYASKASRDGVLIAGFHNDYVANAVRYGIGGLVATVGIFLMPLLFFAYCLRYKKVKSYAMAGIGYILIQSVSSLSYHVLDFKFMASFYALMIAVLLGVIVNKIKM
jgi:O-antigen ligase